MKNLRFKVIASCILFAFFAMNSYGQNTTKTTKEDVKKKAKLEKTKVPKVVTDYYYLDYPVTNYENWYGFPAYDYQDEWYDDWYENGPYSYTDYPEYYDVEFIKDNTPYKAIYSKAGKKIAIHKSLKSDLPRVVSDAISKGEYKDWKLGKDKEEIYKDSDKDQLKIYKVYVEKGKGKHTLFFRPDGKLLKDKKVS